MAEPYKSRPVKSDSLAARLGAGRKRNAIREIENLLARARRVSGVPAEDVASVASVYELDLERQLRAPVQSLYRRYLDHCLADRALSEHETAELVHLRTILQLGDADVAKLHDDVAQAVYGDAIDQVLDDHRLSSEEEAFLERLREDLQLAEPVASDMLERGTRRARHDYIAKTVAYDGGVLASDAATLELTGQSEETMEAAVNAAIEEACRAVPELRWIEVSDVRAEIEDGRVKRWHVKVKASLRGEADE
jgi:flavin-binding protein dodecin